MHAAFIILIGLSKVANGAIDAFPVHAVSTITVSKQAEGPLKLKALNLGTKGNLPEPPPEGLTQESTLWGEVPPLAPMYDYDTLMDQSQPLGSTVFIAFMLSKGAIHVHGHGNPFSPAMKNVPLLHFVNTSSAAHRASDFKSSPSLAAPYLAWVREAVRALIEALL